MLASRPPRCIKPRPPLAEIAESRDESQSFAVHPPVLANLTLRELGRPGDRRRENP
jgi:hypothetical protein